MPKRVQMSRQKPWRAENPDAVIVARPSRWGNPFSTAEYGKVIYEDEDEGTHTLPIWECRRLARADFREFIHNALDGVGYPSLNTIRTSLAGRDLACWCPLDQPCHADVLLRLANP